MTTASIVVKLDLRNGLRVDALARLLSDPRIDLGTIVGSRLPAHLDTDSLREGKEIVELLRATPGIAGVDIVGVEHDIDDDEDEEDEEFEG